MTMTMMMNKRAENR